MNPVNFFASVPPNLSRRATLALAVGWVSALPAWAQSVATSISTPVFVLNSLDASVSVINPATWTETKRIATGKEPHHLYLTPDEKSLIVANALSDSLTFIDPKTAEVQRTVRGIIDRSEERRVGKECW